MTEEDQERGVPPDIAAMIASWPATPAFVRDRYLTVVAANRLARAVSTAFHQGVNLAVAAFEDDDLLREAGDRPLARDRVMERLRESLARHETDARFEALLARLALSDDALGVERRESPGADAPSVTLGFTQADGGVVRLTSMELGIQNHHDLVLVVWRAADEDSRLALARLQGLQ
ncbi:hypothetical protein N1031_16535 [Herbiconiux moechotypicola]|nr:hypothetical protein [Herbiconiux moechotypicola]MCS5731373.1 hypothetical protein [Herbiconiux moechotypicola]